MVDKKVKDIRGGYQVSSLSGEQFLSVARQSAIPCYHTSMLTDILTTLHLQRIQACEQAAIAVEAWGALHPHAPGVQASPPHSLVVPSALMAQDWSAWNHDWSAQCAAVADLLRANRISVVAQLLTGARVDCAGQGRVVLADPVRAGLSTILGPLQHAAHVPSIPSHKPFQPK